MEYAWYLAMEAPFDFTVVKMPVLRKWWCTVLLLENFHLDGHGRRFPRFMEEAKQMAVRLPYFHQSQTEAKKRMSWS
ncbi:unnamed protein product [Gadus morhua 'NCC']